MSVKTLASKKKMQDHMGELVVWVLKSWFGLSKYEPEENAWHGPRLTGDFMLPQEAKGALWPSFTWGLLPCSKG